MNVIYFSYRRTISLEQRHTFSLQQLQKSSTPASSKDVTKITEVRTPSVSGVSGTDSEK